MDLLLPLQFLDRRWHVSGDQRCQGDLLTFGILQRGRQRPDSIPSLIAEELYDGFLREVHRLGELRYCGASAVLRAEFPAAPAQHLHAAAGRLAQQIVPPQVVNHCAFDALIHEGDEAGPPGFVVAVRGFD